MLEVFKAPSIPLTEWFSKVHQVNGEYQLNKTRVAHEQVYDAIIALGAKK